MGAGGGGYMLFHCPFELKHKVGHALCEIVEQELFPLTPQGYLSLPANQSSLTAAHISP
jgi:galactokinase/mevalonate kinase-like predicted kinase